MVKQAKLKKKKVNISPKTTEFHEIFGLWKKEMTFLT